MKSLLAALIIGLSLNASALEVGDPAPCVVINHIQPNGVESEHCIRDRAPEHKFTVLEFFSISCSACQANLPLLTQLGLSIQAQATTRMISIDRSEADVRAYIKNNQQKLPFEIALDLERNAMKAYGVVATPTLYVLDQDLNIAYKHQGILSQEDIKKIDDLVIQK